MSQMKFTCFVALAAMVVLLSESAHGGVPYITDDPVPLDQGHFEIDLATQGFWSKDDYVATLPHFELDYGLTDDLYLHALTPLIYDRPTGTSGVYGYGDTELGIKWRFLKEDQLFKGSPEAAIFPLVELDTGNASRALGNGSDQFFIPIWLLKSWGEQNRQWTLFGGGGYWFHPGDGNENFGYLGIALQRQVADHLTLGAELFHQTVAAEGKSAHTGFNIGAVYDFNNHWHLLMSLGCDIKGDNRLIDYVGIQWTF